jgi:hypothetical protein
METNMRITTQPAGGGLDLVPTITEYARVPYTPPPRDPLEKRLQQHLSLLVAARIIPQIKYDDSPSEYTIIGRHPVLVRLGEADIYANRVEECVTEYSIDKMMVFGVGEWDLWTGVQCMATPVCGWVFVHPRGEAEHYVHMDLTEA